MQTVQQYMGNKKEGMKQTRQDVKDTVLYIKQYFNDRTGRQVLTDIYKDLFGNRTIGNWVYLILLGLIPVIIMVVGEGLDWFGFWTSITGIITVIYVREGRLSNYMIGLVNAVLYLYLSLKGGILNPEVISPAFYGEVFTSIFWIVMNIVGPFQWINIQRKTELGVQDNQDEASHQFVAKRLSFKGWMKYLILMLVTWIGMGKFYESIGSGRPFRDSFTDGTNVSGQFLMNQMYAEQWVFWIVTNIASMYVWWFDSGVAGNWHMVGMYLAQLINSLVGYYEWSKQAKQYKQAQTALTGE